MINVSDTIKKAYEESTTQYDKIILDNEEYVVLLPVSEEGEEEEGEVVILKVEDTDDEELTKMISAFLEDNSWAKGEKYNEKWYFKMLR